MTTAHARATDPATSREAAQAVSATHLESEVLHALRQHGPGTSHQIARHMGRDLVSVSPRFKPLMAKGLIRSCGAAKSETGRKRIVWAAL